MRPLNRGLLWTASCVFALGCSANIIAQDSPAPVSSGSPSAVQSQVPNSGPALTNSPELPDSAGTMLAQASPQQSDAQASAPASQPSTQNSTQDQPQHKLQRPVGTATAPAPGAAGVTAAQPAGVAIAPAKQHRVRTIILRTGAILGAAAAVGTVVALTEATPSKPPGAH
ncbi:MAG TPA: hypothetical protein VKQ11_20295 [Candidatus Sulfotelmatobacter sp.]|nr:hypothetical protein [Candidatus Sulfotelmatobacter sp.]